MKVTDYERVNSVQDSDVLLIDGNRGTKTILVKDLHCGHIILDEDGATYTQRSKLQFEGCEITDDADNGVTVVKCEGGGTVAVEVPTVINTELIYDGTAKTPTITRDTAHTTITGTTEATEFGSYTFTISLSKPSYIWSDNTIAPKTYTWGVGYDGSTITPVNDIQTWLKCAMIMDKSYTMLSEVLNDATTLSALMLSNNAVDYLVRSTSWVSDITGNQTAMTDIGASDYCADKLLADSTWRQAICDSTYFESVLNVKVPVMTSNTAPSGEVTWYPHYGSYPGYQAFNGNESAYQQSAHLGNKKTSGGEWLTYHFDSTGMIIKKYYIYIIDGNKGRSCKYKIQGSNDGINWTDLYTDNDAVIGQAGSFISGYGYYKNSFMINNNDNYTYYRLYMLESANLYNSDYATEVLGLQFYGRAA